MAESRDHRGIIHAELHRRQPEFQATPRGQLAEFTAQAAVGDHAPARDLLAMATVNGAKALALDGDQWLITPGRAVLAIASVELPRANSGRDPLESALDGAGEPEFLWRAN